MRKSVPGGEKSGVVVLAFATAPSLPMLAVTSSPMPELAVSFSPNGESKSAVVAGIK